MTSQGGLRALGSVRRLYSATVALACGALAVVAVLTTDGWLSVDGPLYDLALLVRAGPTSADEADPESAVAVVVLDDRSLASPDLARLPRTFLGPTWAALLDALFANGAKAVGFDFIFQYTANDFIPDFDGPFFAALEKHRDRIVLGRSIQTSVGMPFHFAIGADENEGALGLLEIVPDPDGVFRRVGRDLVDVDGEAHPTLSRTMLKRAGWGEMPPSVLIDPSGPLELSIPSFSLIDVLQCAADPARAELLRAAFSGRMILIGSALPEEDRKPSADRLFPIPWDKSAEHRPVLAGCTMASAGVSSAGSGSVPGVFVHAAAMDAAARGRVVSIAPLWLTAAASFSVVVLGAFAAFRYRMAQATLSGVGLLAGILILDTAALSLHAWIPPGAGLLGTGFAFTVAFATRYVVEERRGRRIQRAFTQYLSPATIERILDTNALPDVGGETRDVAVMMANIDGLGSLLTREEPRHLIDAANAYLECVVEAIEAHGGYVDKFIGTTVMALWGAPAGDDHRTGNLLAASLDAEGRVRSLAREAIRQGAPVLAIRIALGCGPAVVANVGSPQRFNYTALGPTVSAAARLVGLPVVYGCAVLAPPEVVRRLGDQHLFCEIDRVRLHSADEPLSLFEPIAPLSSAGMAERAYVAAYGEALAAYRRGAFADA
ncbi:MAG: adenylate/guanylate cyclase domain-containing protein, partial [Alphaproteobacteria bacterium]|nr:adenylate/guanylate cyclase domain-containing protein [Alphaproteobacteria bacterium]